MTDIFTHLSYILIGVYIFNLAASIDIYSKIPKYKRFSECSITEKYAIINTTIITVIFAIAAFWGIGYILINFIITPILSGGVPQ